MIYPIEIKGKTKKQVTKLNLSGLGLTEFPENIFEYPNLTKLVLSNNRIKSIPKELLTLKKLKVLDLANNEIAILQSSVFKMPKLTTLNLYGNNIKKFPKQITGSSIQKLMIGKKPIEDGELDKLHEVCEVVGNDKKTVDKQIADEPIKADMKNKSSIFISYSHKDAEWLDKVTTHLKPLGKYYGIDEWDDRRLRTGDKWEVEITEALHNSIIAIILFSANYMASDFIVNNELQPLLENAEKKGTKIMTVIISSCATFKESGLSEYQAVNSPDNTLMDMTPGKVEKTLSKLVEDIKSYVNK